MNCNLIDSGEWYTERRCNGVFNFVQKAIVYESVTTHSYIYVASAVTLRLLTKLSGSDNKADVKK